MDGGSVGGISVDLGRGCGVFVANRSVAVGVFGAIRVLNT
jgi:hypothetical protein